MKNDWSRGAAWMWGQIMPIADARLPVTDWGLTHSDITDRLFCGNLASGNRMLPCAKISISASCKKQRRFPDGPGNSNRKLAVQLWR